jgi:hypothetical protein
VKFVKKFFGKGTYETGVNNVRSFRNRRNPGERVLVLDFPTPVKVYRKVG